MAPPPPSTYAAAMDAGHEAVRRGSVDAAEAAFAQAVALAQDASELTLALSHLARAYGTLGRYADANRVIDEALKHAGGSPNLIATVQMHQGIIRWHEGRMHDARALLEVAQISLKRLNMLVERMVTLNNLGIVLYAEGEYGRALEVLGEAARLAEEMNDWPRLVLMLNNVGLCYLDLGAYAEAERDLRRCLALGAEHGLEPLTGGPWLNLGRVHFAGGDPLAGRAAMDEALRITRLYHVQYMERQVLGKIAEAQLAQGALDAAEATANELLALDSAPHVRAEAQLILGLCALARGQPQAARALFLAGLPGAETTFSKVLVLRYHAALAQLVDLPEVARIHRQMASELIDTIVAGLRTKELQAAFRATPLVRSVLAAGRV